MKYILLFSIFFMPLFSNQYGASKLEPRKLYKNDFSTQYTRVRAIEKLENQIEKMEILESKIGTYLNTLSKKVATNNVKNDKNKLLKKQEKVKFLIIRLKQQINSYKRKR